MILRHILGQILRPNLWIGALE